MSTAEVSSESSHDSVKQSPIPRPAPRPPPIPPQLAHELPQGRVNVEDYRLPLLPEDIVGQLDDLTKDHHRSVPRWQRFLTSVLDSWHIHRFCDIRQVKWQEMIEPSGSNIAHLEDLYLTYLWYWDWLEWIHCDSIIGVSDADIASLKANNRSDYNRPSLVLVRYEELKVLLARIKELARTNLAKAFPNPRIPDGYLVHHPEYEWVYTWRKEMHKTLIAMAEHYPAHGYPDMGDLDRVDEAFRESRPNVHFMSLLHNMSEELEKSYSHWHVDDYEFEKRIHMFNEETHSALMPDHADAIYIEYHKEMYEMIREISRQAYRTFDYRLMRDWIFGRPWKQIHVILDSDEQLGIYEVAEHAKEIIEEGGWLSRRLFSVLPKDLHTLSETQCPVCIEAWENGDIVTELHCGHFFHNICLLEYWDKPHMYRHRCPICRQFPRLNVSRQRVPRERNDKRTLQTDEARTWLELNAHAVMEEIADEPDMGPINELKWQELASWQRIEWIQLEREYEGLEGGGRVRNFWA